MTVLVFGGTGQVGSALAGMPDVRALGRAEADLTDPDTCAEVIRTHQPSAVINAAAYTAVDKAEEEPDLAHLINAEAPGAMARACADLDVPLVHISTDYVFDGSGSAAWLPDDPTGPLGVYGRTKLAGEAAVIAAGGTHAILRTSWVFSAVGTNFVKTMLRLGAERDGLSIVDDQIGGPTSARPIAAACHRIAAVLRDAPAKAGTYHFAGAPDCSWADFAAAIFDRAGLQCDINRIPTADYHTPATRPLNSRLDCSATAATFDITRPDWRADVAQVITELRAMA